jgi:hypothetical protein
MAYATVISANTSTGREIWFATAEVASQRQIVADLVRDEALQAAEADGEAHDVDLAKILAIKVEPCCNFATAADGQLFTDVPDSICNDLVAFQNEIKAVLAAGETINSVVCSVE